MNEGIKPCPSCGKTKIRIEPVVVREDIIQHINHYQIEFCCQDCGLVKPVPVSADTYNEAIDKAVAIWNASVNEEKKLKINNLDKFLDKESPFPKIEKQETVESVVYKASIDIQKHVNEQIKHCLIGFCKKLKEHPIVKTYSLHNACEKIPKAIDETLKEVLGEKE